MTNQFLFELENELSRIFFDQGEIISGPLRDIVLTHPEPQRKGKRKGDPIGFSRWKVWCAFLTALGYTPKEILCFLSIFGVAYQSIRNWKGEKPFNHMVSKYQDEISTRFVDRLVELSDTTDWDAGKTEVQKIFGKAENYGRDLTRKILLAIVKRLNESRSLFLFQTTSTVISALFDSFPEEDEFRNFEKVLETDLNTHVLVFIYHKVRKHLDILGPPPQGERLLCALKKYIYLTGLESRFLNLDRIKKLVTDESWVSDEPQFTGTIDFEFEGRSVSRRGRPRRGDK